MKNFHEEMIIQYTREHMDSLIQVFHLFVGLYTRMYPNVSGLSHNKIYAYLWYYSLRSNTKGYGSKTH
jgi:hypothetical protein